LYVLLLPFITIAAFSGVINDDDDDDSKELKQETATDFLRHGAAVVPIQQR